MTDLQFRELIKGGFSDLLYKDFHLTYPKEFEYYLIALEVRDLDATNEEETIKRLLIFPVNPEKIMNVESTISNIKKTQRGIVINNLETFIPVSCNITGTFGRKMRLLYGSKTSDDYSFLSNFSNFKTGFGVKNELQEIFDMSKSGNSNGRPYRIIFHNLINSNSSIVQLEELRWSMSMDKNRLWTYDMQYKIVAPLEYYEDENISKISRMIDKKNISRYFEKVLNNATFIFNSYTKGISKPTI